MDVKISRNAPCPCGSGKKYKKCCGANEVISLTQVLETEIDELQKELLHYALRNFGMEMEENFEEFQQEFFLRNEDEIKFFEFVHTIWFSLFAKKDNGEKIVDQFISTELRKIKRPKLKQVVQSWKDARVIFGRILSNEDNSFVVEDLLTSEQLEAIVVTKIDKQYEENVFFAGILVPFDQKYVFFPAPFDLPNLVCDDATQYINHAFIESNYDSRHEFLTDFFMELMYELPEVGLSLEMDELEWPAPVYQEVAELFQAKFEEMGADRELIETGVLLWYSFCQKKQKRIKNPNIYVAALHYFLSVHASLQFSPTQKELAALYGVSTGSFSAVYRELEDTLGEELDSYVQESPALPMDGTMPMPTERAMHEVLDEIQEKDFKNVDEINEFLAKKLAEPAPRKLKDNAQELLYDAFETEGPERYRLAEKALKLNPNLVDAYNILAENVQYIEDAIELYEKGMWIGQKNLGKAFFKENKGHFWGIFETRPFMRAKFNYAEALYELGRTTEAIAQFEELLELNPNDNQGVRFTLFIVYVEAGDFAKALKLLDTYVDDTAQNTYNRLLLELLMHGFSARANALLKTAKESNKYVVPYLNEKKRIPEAIPEYYGFGDMNEAIIYADAHLHLWREVKDIKKWLK